MRKYLLVIIIFGFLLFIPVGSTQEQPRETYDFLSSTFPQIGIDTNAEGSTGIFQYRYQEKLEVKIDVFDLNQTKITNKFYLNLRISLILDTLFELSLDYQSTNFDETLIFQVYNFTIQGSKRIDVISNIEINQSDTIIKQFESDRDILGVSFALEGVAYPNSLQVNQFVVPNEPFQVNFSSFEPKIYDSGPIPFSSWLTFLEFTKFESILVASAVVANIGFLSSKININGKEFDIGETTKQATETLDEHIEDVRAGKEVYDLTADSIKTSSYLGKDHTNKWITKFTLITFAIYLLLMIGTIFTAYYSLDQFPLVILSFQIYATVYQVILILGIMTTLVLPSVISKVANEFPVSHFIMMIIGLTILVFIPLRELVDTVDIVQDLDFLIKFIFVTSTTVLFVLNTVFAGYYLGRAGISWSKLTKKISNKLKIPRSVILILTFLVSFAFVGILFIRLLKAIAVAITIYLQIPMSENVYLITLAATYLNTDMTGSYLRIYGLWIIFFLQSVMALYIHIREKEDESNQDLQSLFRLYRRLSFAYLVGTLSFMIVLIPNTSNIEFLDTNKLLIPKSSETVVYDAWNIINSIPNFKLLVELIMIIGIFFALPSFFIDLKRELFSKNDRIISSQTKDGKSTSKSTDTSKLENITLDTFIDE